MAKIKKAAVPDNISEEYYQISEEILSSFSKYRPPVDLFRFREDIALLYPLYRKGQRLTNEQVEEAQTLCREGSLFVSRSDHPIYVEHIAKQADLVLVLAVGLWLCLENQEGELKRRFLDRLALGLLLHDAGITKLPGYVLNKSTPLKQD